jgi:hypothetical protein
MKKTIITAIAVFASVGALAQGTLNMSILPSITGGVRQNVLDETGAAATGAMYWVGMLAGAAPGSLAPTGAAINFRTGTGAGLFSDATGRVVAGVAPGNDAIVQIVAWKSESAPGASWQSSWDAALVKGSSAIFTAKTGGAGEPPGLPGNMTNFKSFSMIPEPSTIALGFLGAASLLFFRRK